MKTVLMIALASAGLAACHHKDNTAVNNGGGGGGAGSGTVYASLGGEPAVKAVVKDFVEEQVAKDARINSFFANADIPHLEEMLFEQICNATGGGCTYTGKDMKTAHANMHVKGSDFDALVEDLVKSLDKFKVKDSDKQAILGALGPMKGDIVTAQ